MKFINACLNCGFMDTNKLENNCPVCNSVFYKLNNNDGRKLIKYNQAQRIQWIENKIGHTIPDELSKLREKYKENKMQEIKQLDIRMPLSPRAVYYVPIFLIFFVFALLCLVLPSPFNIIGFLLFLIFGIIVWITLYKEAIKDYHLAQTDFEAYKRKMKREQEDRESQEELERQRKALKNISPKCPYCGSYHTSKIGVVSRGISIGIVGLASSKIGKQWHCNHCNSDF